jgi:hypothetical protein
MTDTHHWRLSLEAPLPPAATKAGIHGLIRLVIALCLLDGNGFLLIVQGAGSSWARDHPFPNWGLVHPQQGFCWEQVDCPVM